MTPQNSRKQSSKHRQSETPFYKQPKWIIALFIFFPPVGIYLMLKYMNKPSIRARIALSVLYGLIYVAILISSYSSQYRTIEMDGKSVNISCHGYCNDIDRLGDGNVLKKLATANIVNILSKTSLDAEDTKIRLALPDNRNAIVEISNGRVNRIYDKDYPSITYYSSNKNDKTTRFPASDEIANIKKVEAEKAAEEKAEEKAKQDEKARLEADRKATEDKVPSADGTAELCERQFKSTYPFKGSKVHSITGVVTNSQLSANSRLYKVNVTIQNAYGASYGAVMECTVQKDNNILQIVGFNVY